MKKISRIQPVPIERQIAFLSTESDIKALADLILAVDKILDVSPVEHPSSSDIDADACGWDECHYCRKGGYGFWEHGDDCEHENLRKARKLVHVTAGAK